MADLWGPENVSGTTIRQLLSMTSGIPDFDTATPCMPPGRAGCVPTDPLRKTLYSDPAHNWSPTRLMGVPWVAEHWKGRCKRLVPMMRPFCYSSTNFVLLGMVLAAREKDATWETLDQAAPLPAYLKEQLVFATTGSPRNYTPVHGYDHTTYDMPPGVLNSHDNWEVSGVFSGWTASDIVATAAAVADLTWEVYGPDHNILPEEVVNLMIPAKNAIYGLATFNLDRNTGQTGAKYGHAYGHLGATYGYQSATAYFPGLQAAITVGTNIERDFQEQPAQAMCLAYSALAGLSTNRTVSCTFDSGSYFSGGCKCTPLEDEATETLFA